MAMVSTLMQMDLTTKESGGMISSMGMDVSIGVMVVSMLVIMKIQGKKD